MSSELNLDLVEERYQNLIKNFSPAYLSGSEWYVGPSLRDYLINKLPRPEIVSTLLWTARQLEKQGR